MIRSNINGSSVFVVSYLVCCISLCCQCAAALSLCICASATNSGGKLAMKSASAVSNTSALNSGDKETKNDALSIS